ncbi:MAG: LysM peptidoglycan-binding domain-containing protein, partial [Rhodanobacteraceae bacterium]
MLGIAGCASDGPAPVEDRTRGSYTGPATPRPATSTPRPAASGTYTVQRGDTLYSIAFRNGVDFRDLASWNNIAAPYTIYPGRELRLSGHSNGAARTVAQAPATKPTSTTPNAPPLKPSESIAVTPIPEPATSSAVPISSPPPASTSTTPPPPAPIQTPPETAVAVNGDISWRWPADGAVVGTYVAGDQMRQGIDIAGSSGAPVRAA